MPVEIRISRRWIASSNAEWGWDSGDGWHRGGRSAAAAIMNAAGRRPSLFAEDSTVAVIVIRDTTAEQARDAHQAFFGG